MHDLLANFIINLDLWLEQSVEFVSNNFCIVFCDEYMIFWLILAVLVFGDGSFLTYILHFILNMQMCEQHKFVPFMNDIIHSNCSKIAFVLLVWPQRDFYTFHSNC